MPKISVIVPVYNVELYIERCAVSLFEQTLEDIEYIFVNDCTPDNSIEILKNVLKRYPKRKLQTQIITLNENSGQAIVRNKGLEHTTGDFVIHCDSDDWVELDMYEKLYTKAIETNADIVVCNFSHETKFGSELQCYTPIKNPQECVDNDCGQYWWTTWNRLVKRNLIINNNINFVSGINYFEDMCYMMRLYYFANYIEYISEPLYHYNRINESSTLNIYSIDKKNEQKKICYDYLDKWFLEKGFKLKSILRRKIDLKNSFLVGNSPDFNQWRAIYPEVVISVTADITLKKMYRKCYALAAKGFYLPLRFYMWLGKYR